MMKFLAANIKYFIKDFKKSTLNLGYSGIAKGRWVGWFEITQIRSLYQKKPRINTQAKYNVIYFLNKTKKYYSRNQLSKTPWNII